MIVPLGQSCALVTFANAYLAGAELSLDNTNRWFWHGKLPRFQIHRGGKTGYASDPEEWFEYLRETGFTRARMYVPVLGETEDISLAAWIAADTWLPSTSGFEQELIWSRASNSAELPPDPTSPFSGSPVDPEKPSMVSTHERAMDGMAWILERLIDFEEEHAPTDHFTRMFKRGLEALDGACPPDELTECTFPAGHYPESSYRLAGAVNSSWALGGMNWWNDRVYPDIKVMADYVMLIRRFYNILGEAVVAACNVDIQPIPPPTTR